MFLRSFINFNNNLLWSVLPCPLKPEDKYYLKDKINLSFETRGLVLKFKQLKLSAMVIVPRRGVQCFAYIQKVTTIFDKVIML